MFRRAITTTWVAMMSCAADDPSLTILDAPSMVQAGPETSPDLVITLEARGFDRPMQFRVDNFTTDQFVDGEIDDQATVTIRLAGCFAGSDHQGNLVEASIGRPEDPGGQVTDRADVMVVCVVDR
jgi:hypothetical protein